MESQNVALTGNVRYKDNNAFANGSAHFAVIDGAC